MYFCVMNIENVIAQMRKGVLDMCILSILSAEPAYATDIIEKLKEHQLIVVEGTLYPLLTRLKNDGYLQYRWEESRSGPPRKYYELSESGREFLGGIILQYRSMSDAIESLIKSVETKSTIK